jgi:AhpD family alkylhydroperoxidase
MPRIAPVAWNDLDAASRAAIEDGINTGMYPEPVAMQVIANSPEALAGMHASYAAVFGKSALGTRLQELIRIRSALLNGCDMCAAARKDASLREEELACEAPIPADPRERAALKLLDLMVRDHHAIGDDMLRELATVFTTREIVELGWFCGTCIGTHRFMHMLDMLGTEEPILAA